MCTDGPSRRAPVRRLQAGRSFHERWEGVEERGAPQWWGRDLAVAHSRVWRDPKPARRRNNKDALFSDVSRIF